jgi:ABC-type transport system involved in multi-copper enzyme maturation permease subunit
MRNEVMSGTGSYQNILGDLLMRYAIFHGAVTLFFTTLAIWRVRRVYIRQRYGTPQKGEGRKGRRHPPIKDDAMMWKERRIEARFQMGKIGVAMFVLLALIVLGFGLYILGYYGWRSILSLAPTSNDLAGAMNLYVRVAGTLLTLVLVLVIGVRAAGSIGSERERQTMDGLLASPLEVAAIIRAKWWGSIHSGRWLFYLLCMVWCFGLAAGGLHILALSLLLILVGIYAAFMASLGMFFAAASKTTLRAMMQTIGTALFVGGGHWFCCSLPLGFLIGGGGPGSEWIYAFLAGITPPIVLGLAAFQGEEYRSINQSREGELFFAMTFGVLLFAVAAMVLRVLAVERFQRTCGRIDGHRRGEPIVPAKRIS